MTAGEGHPPNADKHGNSDKAQAIRQRASSRYLWIPIPLPADAACDRDPVRGLKNTLGWF